MGRISGQLSVRPAQVMKLSNNTWITRLKRNIVRLQKFRHVHSTKASAFLLLIRNFRIVYSSCCFSSCIVTDIMANSAVPSEGQYCTDISLNEYIIVDYKSSSELIDAATIPFRFPLVVLP